MKRRARLCLIWVLCVASGRAGNAAAANSAAHLEEAKRRAAACLARDFDGRAFRDPYLTYVDPEEKLPSPTSAPGLTYRQVDADIMLVLLGRLGGVRASLRPAVDRAQRVLRELPPLWAGKGFSNVRRDPDPSGIALDTFCIVGWLQRDRSMARAVGMALDGDGWLPGELYDGEEEFRRTADEAWCLKLLASEAGEGIATAQPALERLISDFRNSAKEDPAGRQTFYAAYHLALLLEEAKDPGKGIDESETLRAEVEKTMEAWASTRPVGEEKREEILEWVNLATALPGLERSGLRRRSLNVVLRQQGDDGCWRIPGARPPETGSSFATLRALLALSSYRGP